MDGVDAVLVDFSKDKPQLLSSLCFPYPDTLRQVLKALCDEQLNKGELNTMASADRQTAMCFAKATLQLLDKAGIAASEVVAIGSHGQTIRHYPDGPNGFSVQIGCPNTIAVETGIDVIADFRRKDIALGGQGAPMVPAFHQYVFQSPDVDRVIVNLGGIANITYLPKDSRRPVIGYDTGPANTLSDQWAQKHLGKHYDEQGQWASSGQCITSLLGSMLEDQYFAKAPPKSTGREKFSLNWLEQYLTDQSFKPQDVQNTLVALSAHSLARQIQNHCDSGEIYLCGGGSLNAYLVSLVNSVLPNFKVYNTSDLGVPADWVEAMAFGYLARAFILQVPGNIPTVTGAKRPAVLGCRYLAK